MILKKILESAKKNNLTECGDSVLIGLSGGADSVCLTHALYKIQSELGITLYTAHLNHGIRGDEAMRDENFAKEFSKSLGIPCFIHHANVPQYAKEQGISEEAAGRRARYDFFEEICKTHNISKIATAHNKNDNAETVIMNFMRGSSLGGLCGIPYKRNNVIRPLLDVSREEIEEYCKANGLPFVTDSTNLTDDYTRNKIRHTIIPLIIKDFNSNIINTLCDNAMLIKEDNRFINDCAKKVYNSIVCDGTVKISELKKCDISLQRRVIRKMLEDIYGGPSNITAGYVNDIIALADKQSGREINLHDNVSAKVQYDNLIIGEKADSADCFYRKVAAGNEFAIEEIGKKVRISFCNKRENDGAVYLSCNEDDEIVIRSRRTGDIFYPSGMSGSKKIKDYFINKKIPKEKRNSIPVIEINGQIAAVGNRVDRNFLFMDKGIKIEFIAL